MHWWPFRPGGLLEMQSLCFVAGIFTCFLGIVKCESQRNSLKKANSRYSSIPGHQGWSAAHPPVETGGEPPGREEVVPFHSLAINWSLEMTKIIVDKKSRQVLLEDTNSSQLRVVKHTLSFRNWWCHLLVQEDWVGIQCRIPLQIFTGKPGHNAKIFWRW